MVPLGNRDITQLITFTAGAAIDGRTTRGNYGTGAAGSYGATAFPSLAGGITGSVAFSLDGGTHNDPLNNAPARCRPTPSGIQSRNELARRPVWLSLVRRRERRHALGHERVSRQRIR
jgi:hypothetical protein